MTLASPVATMPFNNQSGSIQTKYMKPTSKGGYGEIFPTYFLPDQNKYWSQTFVFSTSIWGAIEVILCYVLDYMT